MIERHPALAPVEPSAAARTLHEVIGLALGRPTVWPPNDLAPADRRKSLHHGFLRTIFHLVTATAPRQLRSLCLLQNSGPVENVE